ncbi:MAG: D-glycero-beta-D-manno-heptose-7-phosphate kinase [Candidatus Omnitrophica bacterium]|nr:D-glycero-beta-D-manno-heptose-7-phosphate kinase [Candidatus Omnitrophota bacterium]
MINIDKRIIDNFKKARILVIGDLILDKFIWGNVDRISPEAPVPVVYQVRESYMPGGASNVTNNLSSLKAKEVLMVGLIGRDSEGRRLKAELKKRGVNISGVFTEGARQTTLKTRIIAHHQQVVRLDHETTAPIKKESVKRIVNFVKRHVERCDAIIIEDYGKGVIDPGVLEPIIAFARSKKKIITVDPKEDHFKSYKNVTTITPNLKEACEASGQKFKKGVDVSKIGKLLMSRLNLKALLITMGDEGMQLMQRGKKSQHIPTLAQEVFDVSGAGDTVIAVFTLALACGADFMTAAHLANICAGIVVGKVGVATVSLNELSKGLNKYHG